MPLYEDDDREEAEDFADWWDSLTFYDEEGENISDDWKEEHGDIVWALEYAFEHEWDLDALLDDWDYEDMADFWEWFRENYG